MTVSGDVPCVACGYDLRTLPVGGRCPECDASVAASLQSGLLRFADEKWLLRVRRGVRQLVFAVLSVPALLLLYPLAMLTGAVVVPLGLVILVVGFAAAVMGLLQVSAKRSDATATAKFEPVRKLTRLLAGGWVLTIAIGFVLGRSWPFPGSAVLTWFPLALAVVCCSILIRAWMLDNGDPRVARRATFTIVVGAFLCLDPVVRLALGIMDLRLARSSRSGLLDTDLAWVMQRLLWNTGRVFAFFTYLSFALTVFTSHSVLSKAVRMRPRPDKG